jgi:hypothetical protein
MRLPFRHPGTPAVPLDSPTHASAARNPASKPKPRLYTPPGPPPDVVEHNCPPSMAVPIFYGADSCTTPPFAPARTTQQTPLPHTDRPAHPASLPPPDENRPTASRQNTPNPGPINTPHPTHSTPPPPKSPSLFPFGFGAGWHQGDGTHYLRCCFASQFPFGFGAGWHARSQPQVNSPTATVSIPFRVWCRSAQMINRF